MAEKTNPNVQENTTAKAVPASSNLLPIVGALIAIAVIIVIAIIFNNKQGMSSAASSTSKYTVLFKNIDLTESATIIESLKNQGIKDYKIEDGGATILVPKKFKDSAAIKIAGEGIMPNGGAVGFEIFDKGGQLGATDFDKQVKLSRAIGGELSRNIRRIYGIEDARVQVVIPQKELFAEKKNPVQAAVFVKVAPDMLLTPAQVQGIISLVASSVEDLKKENVTVVDYNGRILSSEEYMTEYDRLFALLQRQKLELSKGATKDFQKLLLGETKTTGTGEAIGKDGYDVASIYNKLRTDKKSKGLQLKTSLYGRKISGEATLQQKMQFKKEYEGLLERNVRAIAYQFFPKNAVAAKVNVELNNLEAVNKDPISMIARTTTVLLLDENNKNIKITPEIREALFKSLSSAVGYINGRDRIDLRWAPMINFYDKNVYGGETTKSSFFFSNLLASLKQLRLPNINLTFLFYIAGFFILIKIVSMLRKPKVVIPETETAKPSIFEQKKEEPGFEEIKDQTVEQIKKAVEKSPEKVAGIIEQWFQEDQNQ